MKKLTVTMVILLCVMLGAFLKDNIPSSQDLDWHIESREGVHVERREDVRAEIKSVDSESLGVAVTNYTPAEKQQIAARLKRLNDAKKRIADAKKRRRFPARQTTLANFLNDNEVHVSTLISGKQPGDKIKEDELFNVFSLTFKTEQAHLLTDDVLESFKQMRRLYSIDFSGKEIADVSGVDFDHLIATLPNLRKINLKNTNIENPYLAELREKYGSVHFATK